MQALVLVNPKFMGAQPLSFNSYRQSIRGLVRSHNCGVGLAVSRTSHTGRFALATAFATKGYAENKEIPEYWAVHSQYYGSFKNRMISAIGAIQKDQLDDVTALGTELAAMLHAIKNGLLEHVRPFETELFAKLDAIHKEQLDNLAAYEAKLSTMLREIHQEELEDFAPFETELTAMQHAIENGLLEDAAFGIKFYALKQAIDKEFDEFFTLFPSKVKKSYKDMAEIKSELYNKLDASNEELLKYVVDKDF